MTEWARPETGLGRMRVRGSRPGRRLIRALARGAVAVPYPMDDPSLADDPTYRAGVLMGRQQSITDVIERLLDPGAGADRDRLEAIMAWCRQAQEESRIELEMIVAALRDDEA